MKTQTPYTEALAKASELIALLAPFCSKIDLAGSIRRQRDYVGDIEICCIVTNRNQLAMKLIEIAGVGLKREARYLKFNFRNLQVDLFLPQPHDYGRQLAIRTGSAEYSHRVLASTWVKKGCKGTDAGLVDSSGKVVPFETEESFFHYLGLKYIEPRLRI